MHRAYLSLGSNINAERNLPAAVRQIAEHGRLLLVSRVWESPPVDGSDQPNYLNAAVLLLTPLKAEEIATAIIAPVESALGRVRDPANKYRPRTIDVDLSLYDDAVLQLGAKSIPDPDILTRPFVARPLADVDPDYVHPIDGRTLGKIADSFGADLKYRFEIELAP